mmetsp:Transcript_55162/g.145615  ORF Transcript_55162/g.145615 Transcript_55162/m.145615 type:complete len:81 (+) Transcript_55162:204-446(+)
MRLWAAISSGKVGEEQRHGGTASATTDFEQLFDNQHSSFVLSAKIFINSGVAMDATYSSSPSQVAGPLEVGWQIDRYHNH